MSGINHKGDDSAFVIHNCWSVAITMRPTAIGIEMQLVSLVYKMIVRLWDTYSKELSDTLLQTLSE